MKLTKEQYAHVRTWIYRHARPLEAACFAYLFEDGSREEVLRLLALYQNEDGGFAHALEPDCWNPLSTPYQASCAIHTLMDVGAATPQEPVVQGILRYLRSGDGFENHQWLFSVPSNDLAPCAPWWDYNPQSNGYENIGLTAELAAFILRVCEPGDPLYEEAKGMAKRTLDHLLSGEKGGEMATGGYMALLEPWEALGMAKDMDAVRAQLCERVNRMIVRDPSQWMGYVPRPSSAIRSPGSIFYPGNERAIETELDWLVATLPEDDVWPINWQWYKNGERYPKAFAVSETWWKAIRAIETLSLLRSFDWME